MANAVVDAPIQDFKFDENVAVPATSAANTVQRLYNAYHGYREVLLSGAATAEFGVALAPRCVALLHDDGTTYTDMLGGDNGLINRSVAGSSGTILDAMADATERILIASTRKFRGVWIEVAAANGNAATAAVRYSKNDGTWADASGESDGTASGGATLAVDGNLTWTVPSDWGAEQLGQLDSDDKAPLATARLYWAEIKVSADLDADVEIDAFGLLHEIAPSSATATDAQSGANQKVSSEYTFDIGEDVGGIELQASGTTATTVDISWIKR